ncbi:hypothetical protein JR316_0002912 [Psilocybe cubensis]|uniref:Uncharacterized protein n=2 Tax=Psilocybe cubensis TaxID=181762 RepID=A0ACB8H6J1_PSICU|nr:hypothetical protein JR316_0002912 [Psilocybe cubensis]KAH9483444.1 hypothetical protein JR316_0002912 [Psilocybe cubensis]
MSEHQNESFDVPSQETLFVLLAALYESESPELLLQQFLQFLEQERRENTSQTPFQCGSSTEVSSHSSHIPLSTASSGFHGHDLSATYNPRSIHHHQHCPHFPPYPILWIHNPQWFPVSEHQKESFDVPSREALFVLLAALYESESPEVFLQWFLQFLEQQKREYLSISIPAWFKHGNTIIHVIIRGDTAWALLLVPSNLEQSRRKQPSISNTLGEGLDNHNLRSTDNRQIVATQCSGDLPVEHGHSEPNVDGRACESMTESYTNATSPCSCPSHRSSMLRAHPTYKVTSPTAWGASASVSRVNARGGGKTRRISEAKETGSKSVYHARHASARAYRGGGHRVVEPVDKGDASPLTFSPYDRDIDGPGAWEFHAPSSRPKFSQILVFW